MPVTTPPPTEQGQDDLQALIEEARRRARRRRLRYLGMAGGLLVLGVVAYLALGPNGGSPPSDESPSSRLAGSANGSDMLFLRTTSSDRLVAVDPRTGRLTHLPINLDCGDTLFCLIPTGGQLVIGSVGTTSLYAPGQPGRPKSRKLGRGWFAVPSATDGRVWLAMLAHGKRGGAHQRQIGQVREVNVDGRILRTMRPPGGRWPVQAVRAGLLFQAPPDRLRFWSFAAQRVTRSIPGGFPSDAVGNEVASCGESCPRYRVTNVRSGAVTRIRHPPGYSFLGGYDGAFSPEGSRLALPVQRIDEHHASGHRQGAAVAIADLGTGTAQVVPGAGLDPIYRAMAWSSSGALLFFGGPHGTVMSYRLGSARPSIVTRLSRRSNGSIIEIADLPSS